MSAAHDQREAKTANAVQRKEEGGSDSSSAGASGALKGGLRGASFAEGSAMLTPAAGAPPASPSGAASGAIQRKLADPVQRDATAAESMPDNVDLRSARVSFTLPAQRTLSGSMLYDATTRFATTVTIAASPDSLRISTSPALPFDVTFPGANMNFGGAGVRFATGEAYAEFYTTGIGFDCTATGRETVVSLITRAIAGSAMARPGYNPMQDADLTGTLMRVKANFDALPEAHAGGDAGVAAADVSQPTIAATLAMRTPFFQAADGAGVRVNAGGQFDVTVAGTGNLARILATGNPQDAAMAAGIRDVTVSSEAIELIKDGEAIAKLQSLRIAPGGAVTLQRFELIGSAGAGAGFESLFRLIVGAASMAERGVPVEVGIAATARSGAAEPEIVRGLARAQVEEGLTAAVRGLLRENRNAVPGIDLGLVFGAGG